MDLLVKAYLRDHTFRELEEEHGVMARPNASFDKFALNYNQLLIKNGDLLAEQCRGTVIRVSPTLTKKMLRDVERQVDVPLTRWRDRVVGDVEVLAWPMDRFYNLGDVAGADVDWNDHGLRVYEKLDGTMIVVYWDPLQQRWHAGTRSVPEADLPIRNDHMEIGNMTFSELFFTALQKTREASEGKPLGWTPKGFDEVVHLNKELTYVFELTTPLNRIVVKYDEPRVTLLAARHTASGEEVKIESLRLQHVQRPKTWELKSPSAIDAFVNSADPAALEGAVACDSRFRRLKVKNKAWVLSSKAKDLVTVSRRSALLAIIRGEIDDVIPLVEKDIAEELQRMRSALGTYLRSIDERFLAFKQQASDRKSFALLVIDSGDWTPAYFNLWERRSQSAYEWLVRAAVTGKLSDTSLDVLLSKL